MKRRLIISGAFIALFLLASLNGLAHAASGSYTLSWWSVDGGGGLSRASAYSLSGVAGQPDAAASGGAGYQLGGGFWPEQPGEVYPISIYLPLVVK
jgi:hypothetical protein